MVKKLRLMKVKPRVLTMGKYGLNDGENVGINDGINVGITEGEVDGNKDGKEDGTKDGTKDGDCFCESLMTSSKERSMVDSKRLIASYTLLLNGG